MKDCQKVFIKGDLDRGDEVIKALTDLGANNPINYCGRDSNGYYYINPNGEIGYAYIYEFSPEYLLVKEFYREIQLSEIKKWKDGDLLVK